MSKVLVFNSISLDGYFVDASGSMRWAYTPVVDTEWNSFVESNASGGGILVFGRVTFDLMASYWPTPTAEKANPVVAKRMTEHRKLVFSRSLKESAWKNTRIVNSDPAEEVRRLKDAPGNDMAVLGSGSIVAQLCRAGLVDEYQFVLVPIVLGGGRTMFDGIKEKVPLERVSSRTFQNGNVVLSYKPAATKQ